MAEGNDVLLDSKAALRSADVVGNRLAGAMT